MNKVNKTLALVSGVILCGLVSAQAANPFTGTQFFTDFPLKVIDIVEGIGWAGGIGLAVFALLAAFRGFKKISSIIMS